MGDQGGEGAYAQAGVSIDRGNRWVEAIKPLARMTDRSGVVSGIGGFGGVFRPDFARYSDPVLVSGTDGVGTKLLVARWAKKFDGLGIDLQPARGKIVEKKLLTEKPFARAMQSMALPLRGFTPTGFPWPGGFSLKEKRWIPCLPSRNNHHEAHPHIEDAKHFLKIDRSLLLNIGKDRGNGPRPGPYTH